MNPRAGISRPTPLAGESLQPLEYFSISDTRTLYIRVSVLSNSFLVSQIMEYKRTIQANGGVFIQNISIFNKDMIYYKAVTALCKNFIGNRDDNLKKFTEAEMYPPVREYFERLGYVMQAEVNGIDAVAVKDDEMLLFELKKSFNVKLLFQAMDRLRISPNVYTVIPRPKNSRSSEFINTKQIISKLGLGLVTVAMDSPVKSVDVIIEPEELKKVRTNNRKKASVKKELDGRSLNVNTGGTSKKKILTAFRERSIRIACVMYVNGEVSAAKLVKEYKCDKDAHGIINRNVYGWFKKVRRGVYDLSDEGINEIKNPNGQFKAAFDYYLENT